MASVPVFAELSVMNTASGTVCVNGEDLYYCLMSAQKTKVTFKRYLIIDDKSLPHKQRRSFTRLLIFKIKFSSEPPTRWLTGSAEMTPVIARSARGVHGEVTLTIELVD